MTPDRQPATLSDLLQSQLDCTAQLNETLQAEHRALLSNDVSSLEMITRTKAEASDRLAGLGKQIEFLRQQHGGLKLEALTAQLDGSGVASKIWQQTATLAEQCLKANNDNAALLNAREHQIRSALQLIYPAIGTPTYGRSGHDDLQGGSRSFGSA
ncbi:flagella synthesis protein FlgN [Sinimarinibacterium sp. NLF-5-8]|uniref:flagella synthesis protein FlgN n=1 Tax=Sinimarinibacterium sp. NLF-5-8 TaxID=2698684 RepID=UPI00137BBF71|nr:flagellar protein FlgN [Sinimarinibacterium sp. NLF-5-8]QHS11064.1 flagellar protein FlgN [Sinimarinibacterium sp. NLF-5-8]